MPLLPKLEADTYGIDREDLLKLYQINNRLFGDGSHLTADQRRDLANLMWVIIERIREQPI